MADVDRIRTFLRLTLADGVGAVTFRNLVRAFGDVSEVPVNAPGLLQAVKGVGEKTARAIVDLPAALVDEELAEADRKNTRIICAGDDDFPAALRNLHDCPPLLYVRGEIRKTDALAMGVVGSRRCTHYGLEQAERFGQLLGRAGFVIASGGARGIDTAAHRGAMIAGGRTIAVMGCGLSNVYPPENAELFEEIVAGRGALVSELPMRTTVLGGNFPTRNRIISGLSLGTLIIEAARRSGSLITARDAAEQGKIVFALPGRVDSPMSQGTNELIRNGAILAQDLDDILEHLGDVGRQMQVEEPAVPAIPTGANDIECKLLGVLADGPRSMDELLRTTGLESGKAISAMTMLVLKGAVAQQPGNIFAVKRPGQAKTKTGPILPF